MRSTPTKNTNVTSAGPQLGHDRCFARPRRDCPQALPFPSRSQSRRHHGRFHGGKRPAPCAGERERAYSESCARGRRSSSRELTQIPRRLRTQRILLYVLGPCLPRGVTVALETLDLSV